MMLNNKPRADLLAVCLVCHFSGNRHIFLNKKAPACMIQTGDKLSFLFCQLRIA